MESRYFPDRIYCNIFDVLLQNKVKKSILLIKLKNITFFCRNRAKQNSLTTPSLVFLLLKTSFDCISRIVLFSTWLYVVNEGQFSSAKTAFAYYSTFMVMILFNTICNNSKKYCSSNNWIGK